MSIEKVEQGTEVSSDNIKTSITESFDEARYVKLRTPFSVPGKVFDKLLVDPSDLTGGDYLDLMTRFQREFPMHYQSCKMNKLQDSIFISLVLAKLNPPMTVEDTRRLPFKELSLIEIKMCQLNFFSGDQEQEPVTP
jgi:hypothetical protein